MDDISREPRTTPRRTKRSTTKGPQEVVAEAEASVDEAALADQIAVSRGAVAQEPAPLRIEPLEVAEDRIAGEQVAEEEERAADDRPAGDLPAGDRVVPTDARAEDEDAEAKPRTRPAKKKKRSRRKAAKAADEPVAADAAEAAAAAGEAGAADGEEPTGDAPGEPVEPVEPEPAESQEQAESQKTAAAESAEDDGEDPDAALPLSDPDEIGRVCLALLLTQRDGVPLSRLAEVCGTTQKLVKAALEALGGVLEQAGLPLEISLASDKVKVLTRPEIFPYIRELKGLKRSAQLSPAALETLAVIAYRQPVIRAEIESIRGVKAGPMLRSLLEHKLVKVVGRADVPGRPLQYGTTQTFLDRFGLGSLKELPSIQEFKSLG